jgi:hypothetical protein
MGPPFSWVFPGASAGKEGRSDYPVVAFLQKLRVYSYS